MHDGRYDLTDPTLLFRDDVLADPTGLYRQLRTQAPVWEIPGAATFVVTSERLVAEATARPQDFSSNLGSLLFRGDDGRPVTFDMAPMGDATHVLATADPPSHTVHRKLLQPRLTPGRVAGLEAEVRATCERLVGGLVTAGGGDVMAAIADPLPALVINRVVGLPVDDAESLVTMVLDTNEILAGVVEAEQMRRAAEASAATNAYLGPHLRRSVEGDDDGESLLGAIGGGVRDGLLTFDQGIGFLMQLVGAGTETTTSLIGIAVRRLAEDSTLQQRLRADPALIPAFLEEVLRIEGPFRFHYRMTPGDTTLGGVTIPARSRVLLMWAAANLDPDAYAVPDAFDLDRPVSRGHLAFGRGIHFCIGAPLARLEARVALETLLAMTAGVGLDPSAAPWIRRSIFLRRPGAVPVLVTPA